MKRKQSNSNEDVNKSKQSSLLTFFNKQSSSSSTTPTSASLKNDNASESIPVITSSPITDYHIDRVDVDSKSDADNEMPIAINLSDDIEIWVAWSDRELLSAIIRLFHHRRINA